MSNKALDNLNDAITKQFSELDKFVEKYLRLSAKPTIIGEITKNKLTWRGIS